MSENTALYNNMTKPGDCMILSDCQKIIIDNKEVMKDFTSYLFVLNEKHEKRVFGYRNDEFFDLIGESRKIVSISYCRNLEHSNIINRETTNDLESPYSIDIDLQYKGLMYTIVTEEVN